MPDYRIMIVDDETEVREGIASRVDWSAAGFTIVATAENGQDALEKAENLDLDVVLTDIKMPYMDGLTLGAELLSKYLATKLIILSGFDEFEYAKEAIKLNVLEYVLKPVNANELLQVLQRAKKQLDAEFRAKQDIEALRTRYEQALPLLKDQCLREILAGSVPAEEAARLIELYGIRLDITNPMIVAVFDTSGQIPTGSVITRELLPVSVRALVDGTLEGKCSYATFLSFYNVIVVSSWVNDPVGHMMMAAGEICAECKSLFGVELTAGVGRRCSEVPLLRESLFEARSALEYYRVVGGGKAIYIRDVERMTRNPATLDSRYEQRLTAAVKFGSGEQIETEIDEILSGLGDVAPGSWKYRGYVTGILNALNQIVGRYDLPADEIMGGEGVMLFQEGGQADTPALRQWIYAVCLRIGGYMNQRRSSMAGTLVEKAKQFIADHYADGDLSVENVCEHLHISQSYFSSIFKQDTGRSFVQYLTDIRMDQAVELLRGSDEKTYIIAQRVGYDEPNYFSYVFKRKFGVSPSQYRSTV